jgi:hypothetical protein
MKKFILFSLFALIITGCLNYEQVTTVYGNMSGKMFVHYWTNAIPLDDSTFIKSLKLFNEEIIRKEYSSKFADIKNIVIYKDRTDTTLHAKIDLTFNNIDSLVHSKAFKDSRISIKNLPNGNKVFTYFVQAYTMGFGFDPKDYSMKFVYYLPGKIVNHNADDLTRNRLTWGFSLEEAKLGKALSAVFVPYPLEETPAVIYYLAGFVLLVVFVFIFRKRSG